MFVRKKPRNKLLLKNAIKYLQFDIQRFVNIYNEKSNTLISGTSGNDSIYSSIGDENIPTEKVTIDGGEGNDTIDNESAISLIDAGDGNDYISNAYFGVRSTIKSGLGNDKIENGASSVIIDSEEGDDSIDNSGNSVSINSGIGNDYINFIGKSVTIDTGNGNDTIGHYSGDSVTIYAGEGDDSIYNNKGNFVLIDAGKGHNNIKNAGNSVTINAGEGNDTIDNSKEYYNSAYNVTIYTGNGNNYVNNSYFDSVKINAGEGNDIIKNDGGNSVTINSGKGNDSIENSGMGASVIDAGEGDDYVYNYEDLSTIYSGLGNDTIINYSYHPFMDITKGSYASIIGDKGNDLISLTGEDIYCSYILIQYANGDGNDTILGLNADDTLKISGAKYSTIKSGSDLKVNVGNGSILIKDAANIAVKIVGTMESGSTTNETLQAGMSLKSSVLTASTAFKGNRINLEDYDATKINVSALTQNITIIGSSAANSIKGGKGADIISGVNGKNTIYGGTGNDSILGGSDSDKLLGETGNDSLYGGTGNDTLTGGAGNDIFIYSSGNDLITDYKSGEDKIKIGTITNSTVKGSDVILTTGNGNLTIKGAKDKVVTLEDNSGNSTDKIFFNNISYTPLETGLTYDAQRTILTAASKFSGNSIDLGKYLSTVTKVNASALNKEIRIVGNSSANNSIKGGKGADTISGNSGKDTITGGNGNDSVFGGADNDKLLGEAGNDTLNGGTGNDTLTGGAGQDVFIYTGGNDIIIDYKTGEDKIKLNPSAITSSTVKGSDVVLTTNNGTLTVKSTKDKVVTFVGDNGSTSDKIFFANVSYAPLETGLTYDAKRTVLTASNKYTGSTIDLSEYLGTVTKINATAPSQALNIVGNSSANSIKAGKGSDTINGGSGKDTIFGGNGNDSIYGGVDNDLLKGDAGNDTLNGGTGNDTLTGGAGNDIFVYEGGSDSITDYKSAEDKIKLNPSTITSSTVKGSDVVLTTNNGTLTLKGTKDKVITFIGNNGRETDKIFFANTSYAPLATGLTYDAKRTVLTSSNKFTGSKIDLGEYVGTVTKINAAANSQPLNIIGNSSANSIKGGKGADTISGGKGNDTLTGGGGSDVFVYQGGNDIITDYTAGQDSIKVSGSISNVSYNGKNVIFSIGSGSLTVINAKGKDIAVTDSSNKTQTYSRTIDLLYDNNFMTDEFDIDSVSEVTETNYSVGKIEYSNDNNDFIINSVVSDSSFNKK